MNVDQVGLQLYTVREAAAADFAATLRAVAAAGYQVVEPAGLHGMTPAEVRAQLDELGVRAVAAHIAVDRFEQDAEAAIAELQTLGCSYAVIPFLGQERRGNAAALRMLATSFNEWAERCQAAGLGFAYHNHDFEFATLPGAAGTTFDLFVEATDPALVTFELDIYWAQVAGVDPIALLGRLSGRVPLVHLKDRAAGETPTDAPVGEGTIDWAPVLAAAEAAGTEWYIVEQDHPNDALTDVATSLRNLQGMATR
jgi:sugar phosphate isomerase/epimerase